MTRDQPRGHSRLAAQPLIVLCERECGPRLDARKLVAESLPRAELPDRDW
jgi:hypothetical protein